MANSVAIFGERLFYCILFVLVPCAHTRDSRYLSCSVSPACLVLIAVNVSVSSGWVANLCLSWVWEVALISLWVAASVILFVCVGSRAQSV